MRSRTQATSIVRVRVRLDPIESLVEMRPLWSQCDWKQRRRKFDLATSRRVRISWSAIGWCHVLLVLVGWFNVCTPINAELTARHASLRSHPFRYAYHRTRYHRSHSFSSAWAVLGDPELEYTLKMLEADQLQAALLQFVEWTHEYAQSSDWIEDNTGRSSNDSNTVSGRPGNKYWHSGACVQSTWEPLRSRLRPPTQYEQFGAQAQNARRLADLLSTLLGANDPSSSASSSTSFDSTESANSSDLTLHRPFFWSLLQVHLQADPTLAAVGIVFHPSVQLPLTMHLPPPASDRSSAASSLLRRRRRRRRQLFLSLNDPPNSASASFSSNSTDSTGFAPYVLRLAGPATARTSSSRITPHRFPTTHGGSNDQHHHRRPDHDTDDNEDADGGSPPPFRFVDLARLPAPRPQVVPNRRFASSVSPSPSFSSGLSSSASSVITSASSSSTNQPPSTTGRTRANNAILDRQANQLRALRQNLSAGRAQSYDAQHDTYAYSSSWYTVHAQHAQQNPYWTKSTTGYWSMPYSDCTVASGWLLTYSVPFFGRLADRKPQFL